MTSPKPSSHSPSASVNFHSTGNRLFLIAIEGLDGTGKSTTVAALAKRVAAEVVNNPPSSMADERTQADQQEPTARRAWYLMANRESAKQAEEIRAKGLPVIMDRSVASTLAFGAAERDEPVGPWPADLPRPDLLVVLCVDDAERVRRLTGRRGQRTTEERRLHADRAFRQRVMNGYIALGGQVVDASGPVDEVVERILRMCEAIGRPGW